MDRLGLIRRRLDVDGRVRVVQLAGELDVSEMTIRRDLDVLVDEGVAHRVRGGAVAVGPQQFAARAEQHSRAKGRIADKLVDLVGVGGAIGIDASSTLQRLAARLAPVRDLTVLTNGLDTFRSLQEHPGVTALLTGGELDESTGSLVGPLATRAANDVMLRRLFVSASALDPELGRASRRCSTPRRSWRWPARPPRSSWPSTPPSSVIVRRRGASTSNGSPCS